MVTLFPIPEAVVQFDRAALLEFPSGETHDSFVFVHHCLVPGVDDNRNVIIRQRTMAKMLYDGLVDFRAVRDRDFATWWLLDCTACGRRHTKDWLAKADFKLHASITIAKEFLCSRRTK